MNSKDISSNRVFYLTPGFLKIYQQGSVHINRFIREQTQHLTGDLLEASQKLSSVPQDLLENILKFLSLGLSDNWSQVRFASSVAVRKMIPIFPEPMKFMKIWEELIPKMCLNRYYVAEGVRNYSQDTWKLLVGEQGRMIICELMEKVVAYYICQCEAENHLVREAACQCI